LHLKYSNATVKQDKLEQVAKQIQLFSFFKYGKNYINEIKGEAQKEKTKKKSSYSYMKKRKEKKKKARKPSQTQKKQNLLVN
jgi:hypothetical protein